MNEITKGEIVTKVWPQRAVTKHLSRHQKVPKRYTKSEKIRLLQADDITMRDLKNDESRKPHKKTKQVIDKERALYLAATCENPYPIQEFFTEPSHKGIYVLEGDYSHRYFIRHIDPYVWTHESAYNPKTHSADNAVIITHFVGKNELNMRMKTWTKKGLLCGEQKQVGSPVLRKPTDSNS